MNGARRYVLTLIAILLPLMTVSCNLTERAEGRAHSSMAPLSPVNVISEAGSDVRVVGDGETRETFTLSTMISVHAPSQSEAQQLLDRIRANLPMERHDDRLVLGDLDELKVENAKYRLFGVPLGSYWPLDIDFIVHMPKDHELKLSSGSGDLSVRDLHSSVQLRSRSGDAEIKDVTGDVIVKTLSGDINVMDTKNVTVTATSGDVRLARIYGNAAVETRSGDMRMSHIEGSVKVAATSGDVAIDSAIAPKVDWNIQTRSGDVMLRLPTDSAFNVSLHSRSGDVDIHLPKRSSASNFQTDTDHNVRGTVGEDPAATIEVHASTGDIEIRPMP